MGIDRYEEYRKVLSDFENQARLRHIPSHRDPADWLDMTSNDYMGLAAQSDILKEMFLSKYGNNLPDFSASASRLLSLKQDAHTQLEEKLEDLYGRPALLFNSGYHANTGIISALNLPNTLFVADKLVHASIIDGLKSGRCEFLRFPHNNVAALQKILNCEHAKRAHIVIVVESVYSMDGDKAPLQEIVQCRDKYDNVLLYVDEAHGFGVYGETGLGLCQESGCLDDVDILVGTLGKAANSSGAFSISSREMKDFFINVSRSFIFSTALAPINMAWSEMMIERLVAMRSEREHLKALSRYFRNKLREFKDNVPDGDSPIVPFVTADATLAMSISENLKKQGILALPIRRPTVPAGTERIRFSLNAGLSFGDIDRVIEVLKSVQ